MIGVYHHITDPASSDATIFRALKPGARLLINDFPPTIWLALFRVKGVSAKPAAMECRTTSSPMKSPQRDFTR